MSAPLRLAIFDCDGTLVDSAALIHESVAAAFTAIGEPAPGPEISRRIIGLKLDEALQRLAPDADGEVLEAMLKGFRETFHAARLRDPTREPLFPGCREALELLDDAGILLAIATGKSRRGIESILDNHDLRSLFVSTVTVDEAAGKPNPEMVHYVCREAGVDVRDAILIGDTTYDIEMARHAGSQALGVNWGYHEPAELHAAGARAIAPDFAAVPGLLFNLWAEGTLR